MKNIAIVWGICLVLIFGGLTVFGWMHINQNAPYRQLENDLVEAAKRIDASTLNLQEPVTLTFDYLVERGAIEADALTLEDEVCSGHVVVSMNNFVVEHRGFVRCENYRTRGY